MGSKTSKAGSNSNADVNVKPIKLNEIKLDDIKEFESFNPGQYVWVNRYIHEIEKLRSYKPGFMEDADVVKAISANFMQMCQDQKFNFTYPPRYLEIENIEPRNEIVMYKLVRILDLGRVNYMGYYDFTNYPDFELIMHTVALIELKIDTTVSTIKDGALGGSVIRADELKPTQKYIVQRANINGIQFIGPATHLSEMEKKLKDGELSLVSNFDIHFKYKLGTAVEDPNFGLPGIGCVQGIHAFIDKREAIKYLKTGFSGIDLFSPTITIVDLEGPDPAIEEQQLRNRMMTEARRKRKMQKVELFERKEKEERVILKMIGKDEHKDNEEKDDKSCDVCKLYLWTSNPVAPNCKHKLHYHCIGKANFKSNTCPICRSTLY